MAASFQAGYHRCRCLVYHGRVPLVSPAWCDLSGSTILTSISRYDGIPAVSDYHTLTEILREEWGYEYFVMTDAGGSDRVCSYFHLCESDPIDMEAVTTQLLNAGTDVEMGGGSL